MKSWKTWSSLPLIVVLRVVRVWNQTGQKHAGEPDIAKSFLPSHNYLLWLSVLLTYVDVIQRLSRRTIPWASRQSATTISLAMGAAALTYKVAFTQADAPELLVGLESSRFKSLENMSLVSQARAVFASMLMMMALTSLPSIYQHFFRKDKALGMINDPRVDTLRADE